MMVVLVLVLVLVVMLLVLVLVLVVMLLEAMPSSRWTRFHPGSRAPSRTAESSRRSSIENRGKNSKGRS
jgi:hypothetical protein